MRMAGCCPVVVEKFAKNLADLRHEVSALQARARSQEARLAEFGKQCPASTTEMCVPSRAPAVLASPRAGAEASAVRQLAARVDQQGHMCDSRLRILEGKWEAISISADAAAASAAAAAADAASAATMVSAAGGHRSGSGCASPWVSSTGSRAASPRPGHQRMGDQVFADMQELVAGLRSRMDILEADALVLNQEVANHGMQLAQMSKWRQQRGPRPGTSIDPSFTSSMRHQIGVDGLAPAWLVSEVRTRLQQSEEQSCEVACSVGRVESALLESDQKFHERFSDVEERFAKQQRQVFDNCEHLRSEMTRAVQTLKMDMARAEGTFQGEANELAERLSNGFQDPRGRGLADAFTLEAVVRANSGDLRAVREGQRGLDLQVASITASICACGEEQERLARQATERDQWLRAQLGELAAAGVAEAQAQHASMARVVNQVEMNVESLAGGDRQSRNLAETATSGLSKLEVRIDRFASHSEHRTQQLEDRLGREISDAVHHAEMATEVANAAEVAAERTDADNIASANSLEARLEGWLEARREARRDAREEFRREIHEVSEEAAATASAAASAVAGHAANNLRAAGMRAEKESLAAEHMARQAEIGVQTFRAEENEAAARLARRTEAAVGHLKLELRSASDRNESTLSNLSAAVGDVREELRLEKRRGKESADVVSMSNCELHITVRNEVANALGSFRNEMHDYLARVEAQLAQFQGQHAQEMREHFSRVGDQFVHFEERLAPGAVANLVRREVEDAARGAVFEEIHDLRAGLCQKVDYKFDCTMQCLHVLYLKVGLSPSGALSSLQRAIRDPPGTNVEPPLSPGGPGTSGLVAGALPRPGSPPVFGRREAAWNSAGPFEPSTDAGKPQGSGTKGGPRAKSPTVRSKSPGVRSPQVPSLGHGRRLGDYSLIE